MQCNSAKKGLAKSHSDKVYEGKGCPLKGQESAHAARQVPSYERSDLAPSGIASFDFLLVLSESLHIDRNFPGKRAWNISCAQRTAPVSAGYTGFCLLTV